MKSDLVWLFDLDNTLHDASAAVFPAIARNMTEFIFRLLSEDGRPAQLEQANALRLAYLHKYGATLKGVVDHHGVKQEDFLSAAHQFDDLFSLLFFEKGLEPALRRLPGRKILLTNAPMHYSSQVIKRLRMHHFFEKHISIEAMHVHGVSCPKPSKTFLRKWLASQKLHPRQCVLVEDSVLNIKSAQSVGMRTVHVTGYGPHTAQHKSISSNADITVKSVFDLTRNFRQLYRY